MDSRLARLSMILAAGAALLVFLLVAFSLRFQIELSPAGVYRLDRWTGRVTLARVEEEAQFGANRAEPPRAHEIRVGKASCRKAEGKSPQFTLGTYTKPMSFDAILVGIRAEKVVADELKQKSGDEERQLRYACAAELAVYLIRTETGFSPQTRLSTIPGEIVPLGWGVTYFSNNGPAYIVDYTFRVGKGTRGWAWEVTVDDEWGDHVIKSIIGNPALEKKYGWGK